MNCVAISGRFVKDPELHKTVKGNYWTRFTIAIPAPKANGRDADFIRCVAWDGVAEFICSNFTKGKKIEIQGELRTNTVETVENGEKQMTTIMEVNVEKAFYAEKKDKSEELRENL